MFISAILLTLNVPLMGASASIKEGMELAEKIQNTVNAIANNPLSLPFNIVLLGGYIIYGVILSITMIGALIATILGIFSPVLGPLTSILSIVIQTVIYLAIAIIIIVSLWNILFGLNQFRLL